MTLDMSNTYLEWTRRNFALNNLSSSEHKIERADYVEWLNQPAKEKYDLIVLDPPSFSNSKRMSDTFDVQRDHVSLVKNCMSRLNPAGSLYLTTAAVSVGSYCTRKL